MAINPYAIIIVLFIIGGVIATFWGWRIIVASRRTRDWPVVEGVIEMSELAADDGLFPTITYRYEVAGKTFHGELSFSADITPTPEYSKGYIEKYPVGTRVRVFHEPGDPSNSTLEPGLARGDWLVFALGIVATITGIALLFA